MQGEVGGRDNTEKAGSGKTVSTMTYISLSSNTPCVAGLVSVTLDGTCAVTRPHLEVVGVLYYHRELEHRLLLRNKILSLTDNHMSTSGCCRVS